MNPQLIENYHYFSRALLEADNTPFEQFASWSFTLRSITIDLSARLQIYQDLYDILNEHATNNKVREFTRILSKIRESANLPYGAYGKIIEIFVVKNPYFDNFARIYRFIVDNNLTHLIPRIERIYGMPRERSASQTVA
jgi:hypothetical protein